MENKSVTLFLIFLTNNFKLPAAVIADIYPKRWQIELFFKWIKQHLKIKSFYGNSANAVRTQVWIAISVYLLIAITKKIGYFGSQSPHFRDEPSRKKAYKTNSYGRLTTETRVRNF